MIQSLSEWDQDLTDDEEDVYRSLYRALERTEGFGLFFVRTENEKQLVEKIQKDLPREKVEWLRLDSIVEDGNLYKVIAGLPNRDQINVLFISGIEKSLEPYIQPGYGGQGDYYKLDTVPRILGHLNLQRERFRDDFSFCLVFLVPLFALKYFIRRAPDFFDWRSGVFEFPMDQETLEQRSSLLLEMELNEYKQLTHQERMDCIREIQSLIDEENQSDETRYELWKQQGWVWYSDGNLNAMLASFDQVIALNLSYFSDFYIRGLILGMLERYEEAIESYDKALEIKPDKHEAWYYRGVELSSLGRYEEAIASFEQALENKPGDHQAWNNRGIVLRKLGRVDEAIKSYDQALTIKLDNQEVWYNRGLAFHNFGQAEEAIASFDKALEIKPDYYEAWDSRGYTLAKVGRYPEAIASFDKALEIAPTHANAVYNKATSYAFQADVEPAIELLQQAIVLDPKYREMAKMDSDFDQIRADRRFRELTELTDT
jgi:tetratricopeptide (TPR) repeat protein